MFKSLLTFSPLMYPDEQRKKAAVESLREGNRIVKGVTFNSLDEGSFPVNTSELFKNEVPATQQTLETLCWVQLHPSTECIEAQLTVTVTLTSKFNMKLFPYDSHVVPMPLNIKRPWKESIDTGKQASTKTTRETHAWVMAKRKPVWAPKGWKGVDEAKDLLHVSQNIAGVSPCLGTSVLTPGCQPVSPPK